MSSGNVYIAVIGVGGVGRHFLTQLFALSHRYPQICLSLISRSRKCLFTEDFHHTLSFETWEQDLEASSQPVLTVQDIFGYLASAPGKCILVDNTSSQDVADSYASFLRKGISIVTPNKKAFSGSWQAWRYIFDATYSSKNPTGGLIYHESSVGAGLPVIATLKDLVDTGDEVQRIEGVFSGTMSFLFNSFAPVEGGKGGRWSEIVKKAKASGFTEPDPREDLNGLDVARKLVILARLSGLEVKNTSSFPVQSLIPKILEGANDGQEFLDGLWEADGSMDRMRTEAEKNGKVLRYVGSIDVKEKSLGVGVEKFEKGHPIASLTGSDNIINFYTRRYGKNPLIIQGPGAGGEVTAMGVTADLIKVLQRIL